MSQGVDKYSSYVDPFHINENIDQNFKPVTESKITPIFGLQPQGSDSRMPNSIQLL